LNAGDHGQLGIRVAHVTEIVRAIAHYMTKQPWAVRLDDSVGVARQMLAVREIRHLPVLDGSRLVGIVTERELAGDRTATVDQVMRSVREVDAKVALADALAIMLEENRDALVVTRNGIVDGIFTAMDAVRVLQHRSNRSEGMPHRSA
jgi:predicted transcriptional regulator